ncbi:MAG: protein kinase, partial [Planctomycetia bacterium]|nr:protein kinase [Planctomycetia bacterium]
MTKPGDQGPPPADAAGPVADGFDERIGSLVGGEYRIVERLGAGTMGTVYRARHALLERDFAVKFLHPDLVDAAEVRRRFRVEVTSLASFAHRNAVSLRHCGDDDGRLFLVMDLAPGRTLQEVLATDAPLAPRRAARIAVEVLEALDEAHAAGIVHRDLKPANVMVEAADEPAEAAVERVRVLDFGLARLLAPAHAAEGAHPLASSTRRIVGTIAYMAPEQLLGADVDARTDLFAVGAWLYEALTGTRPFGGGNAADVAAAIVAGRRRPWSSDDATRVPRPLRDVVDRALARSPDDRPASAGQLADALRTAMGSTEHLEGPVSRDRPRRTAWRFASIAFVLAAATVAALGLVRGTSPRTTTSPGPAARARGEAALDAGRPIEALAAFTEALRADPDDVASLLGRAAARIATRDFAALHDVDAAATRLGDAAAPVLLRAQFAVEVEADPARAVDLLSRALWIRPEAVPVREARARAALMAGDLLTAEADATALAQADPTSPVPETLLARVAGNRAARDGDVGRAEDAVRRAEAAVARAPRSAEASMALAYAQQQLATSARARGDEATARAAFDRARRQAAEAIELAIRDPAPARQGLAVPRLRLDRAGICFAAADDAGALDELDAALRLVPRDALLLKTRGFARQRVGRLADAEADFALLHDATRSAEAAFYLGFCAQRAGEEAADRGDTPAAVRGFGRALEVYEQGLARSPGAADLRIYRGEVLARLGWLSPPGPERERGVTAGREVLDVVLAGDPTDTEARLRRAELALLERDEERALADARRAAREARIPTARHHAVHAEAALRRARRGAGDVPALAAEAAEA